MPKLKPTHWQPLHHWTPTLESIPLSKLTKKQIWLKMECHQPSGSFKLRGIGRLCQYYLARGKNHFISSSGGNAGCAVAYAGRCLNTKVTVFVPSTTKSIFINAMKSQGAKVIVHGDVWDEANRAALAFAKVNNAGFVHPFDHPLIWSGHATMIKEVAYQNIKPDAIVVAVGGGGLACGVLEGMQNMGWHDTPLITVETHGTASFANSVKAKKLITLPKINSIATTLGAKRVCDQLWQWHKTHPIFATTVSDEDAVNACRYFANDHRVLVEPACGAALTIAYNKHNILKNYDSILMIVCGGSGMNLDLLN